MAAALTTFLVSMVPVIELRGAIPIGVAAGLPLWEAILISIIGNMIPVPFIILFIKKIFAWMRTKSDRLNAVVERMEAKADKNVEKVTRYEFWGLFLFVAIPLPGTGAWTGSLAGHESEKGSASDLFRNFWCGCNYFFRHLWSMAGVHRLVDR